MRGSKGLDDQDRHTLTGAKLTLIVALVPVAASGTPADFGAINAVLFAMIAALGAQALEERPRLRRRSLPPTHKRPPHVRPRYAPGQPRAGVGVHGEYRR